jgi:preprotein translocase subunit SecF
MRLLKIVPGQHQYRVRPHPPHRLRVTALLTVAAIALVFVRGLNMGVDFVGGVSIEEKFASAPPLDRCARR